MNAYTASNPSPTPISSIVALLALGIVAFVAYWFDAPVAVFLGISAGLPAIFFLAGREAEWARQRKHEVDMFKQAVADANEEPEKVAGRNMARLFDELSRIRKEEGIGEKDSTPEWMRVSCV